MNAYNPYSLTVVTKSRISESVIRLGKALMAGGLEKTPVPRDAWARIEEMNVYLSRRSQRLEGLIKRWENPKNASRDTLAYTLQALWQNERQSAKAELMKHLPEICKELAALPKDDQQANEYRQALKATLTEMFKATFFLGLEPDMVEVAPDFEVRKEIERLGSLGVSINSTLVLGELMEAFSNNLEYRGGMLWKQSELN